MPGYITKDDFNQLLQSLVPPLAANELSSLDKAFSIFPNTPPADQYDVIIVGPAVPDLGKQSSSSLFSSYQRSQCTIESPNKKRRLDSGKSNSAVYSEQKIGLTNFQMKLTV